MSIDIYNETRQNSFSSRFYLTAEMSLKFPLLTFFAQLFVTGGIQVKCKVSLPRR